MFTSQAAAVITRVWVGLTPLPPAPPPPPHGPSQLAGHLHNLVPSPSMRHVYIAQGPVWGWGHVVRL